ncbi:MAG: NUDIX hydrolase [Tepidisphaeraceae bacterium]|jgi:ADP-ribose pyrophosphatase
MSYRLLEKQQIYSGKKIHLEVHRLQDENGRITQREVCVHPGAVVILAFMDDGQILLIQNRRYSIGQLLIELPAGTLEKGEDPMNCAGRELLEETGYLAGRLKPIASFYSSPGVLTEKLHAFAAYDLQKGHTALEEDEEIQVMPTPFEKAVEMIRGGQIQDAKTIATLLLFDRFKRTGS